MCVAIAQPAGVSLTKAEFDRGWFANPHGGGFAYIVKGRIKVFRSLKRRDVWAAYSDAVRKYGEHSPMIVHMRIATHGSVCMENTHPFRVYTDGRGETVIAHNGIIGKVNPVGDESDTRAFVREFLDYLPDDWMDNAAIVELVENYIGSWSSKIVVLTTVKDARSNLYILNESLGDTDKRGIWFSNDSCAKPKARVYAPKGTSRIKGTTTWDIEYDDVRDEGNTTPTRSAAEAAASFFPHGADVAIGGLSEADALEIVQTAIDGGYCEWCFHRPCECEAVCVNCTLTIDDCTCMQPMTYASIRGGSEGAPVYAGIPGRRSLHDLTDSDWHDMYSDDIDMPIPF